MLRHTALFLHHHPMTDAQRLAQMKGWAYLSYGCRSVTSVDFGTDLFGGSTSLLDAKPWERTPLWHARESGPPSNYDVAIHLDFEDQSALDAYNNDDVHGEVGAYDASICRRELTARVDWWYEGPPRVERGRVRHTGLYLWDDTAGEAQRDDVRSAFASLESSVPETRSVVVADNVGSLTTDYDIIVDVLLDDPEGASAFLDHAAQREVAALAAGATKHQWTAKITHTMGLG